MRSEAFFLQGTVLYTYFHEVETFRKIISWIPLGGGSDCAPTRNNGVENNRYLEETFTHSPIDFYETYYFSACLDFARSDGPYCLQKGANFFFFI